MGLTKSEKFTEEQNNIAKIAKVLGHPARVAILQYLLKVQACICGEIVDEIGLSQPTISQHLREMKDIGLISGNIDGTRVCYCINTEKYAEIRSIFNQILGHDLTNEGTSCQ